MKCPNCNKEVSPEWNVCPHCGYKPVKCSDPNCNSSWLPKETRFCPICGCQINSSAISDSLTPKRKTFSEVRFTGASYRYDTLISQDGTLVLYDDKAVFKVGRISLGDKSDKIIPIAEICGYHRNFGPMSVYLRNGQTLRIGVPLFNERELIEALEERRHAIYTNQGKPVPPLTKF